MTLIEKTTWKILEIRKYFFLTKLTINWLTSNWCLEKILVRVRPVPSRIVWLQTITKNPHAKTSSDEWLNVVTSGNNGISGLTFWLPSNIGRLGPWYISYDCYRDLFGWYIRARYLYFVYLVANKYFYIIMRPLSRYPWVKS